MSGGRGNRLRRKGYSESRHGYAELQRRRCDACGHRRHPFVPCSTCVDAAQVGVLAPCSETP